MACALSSSAHGICSLSGRQIGRQVVSGDRGQLEFLRSLAQSCTAGKGKSNDGQRCRPGVAVVRSRIVPSPSGIKQRRIVHCKAKTYSVEIIHGDTKHVLQVPEDETILSIALDENLDVPHDCKLGVCMTCPAKLEKGNVDQSGGMLSEDVIERGYALMCVSYPLSDCVIRTIPEEELLSLQLATANDA